MYKRDNEKDYVIIVNEAVRVQNQRFEKIIIDSQNLAVHFEGRVVPLEYRKYSFRIFFNLLLDLNKKTCDKRLK